jgi:hypothetical protein
VSLYLDASVIVATVAREAMSDVVAQFLRTIPDPPIVSELAAIETASALSRLFRTGAVSRDVAQAKLGDFDSWRAGFANQLDIEPADFRLANAFVRRFELGLRAPDALHAAACRRGGHTLVTLDQRLARAAETLGVKVLCLG